MIRVQENRLWERKIFSANYMRKRRRARVQVKMLATEAVRVRSSEYQMHGLNPLVDFEASTEVKSLAQIRIANCAQALSASCGQVCKCEKTACENTSIFLNCLSILQTPTRGASKHESWINVRLHLELCDKLILERLERITSQVFTSGRRPHRRTVKIIPSLIKLRKLYLLSSWASVPLREANVVSNEKLVNCVGLCVRATFHIAHEFAGFSLTKSRYSLEIIETGLRFLKCFWDDQDLKSMFAKLLIEGMKTNDDLGECCVEIFAVAGYDSLIVSDRGVREAFKKWIRDKCRSEDMKFSQAMARILINLHTNEPELFKEIGRDLELLYLFYTGTLRWPNYAYLGYRNKGAFGDVLIRLGRGNYKAHAKCVLRDYAMCLALSRRKIILDDSDIRNSRRVSFQLPHGYQDIIRSVSARMLCDCH